MNYYLTPTEIAEALGLTQLRKSTPAGMYLLSESDLVPYGIERAKEEGAIELSNNRRQEPSQEATAAPVSAPETTQDGEVTAVESEDPAVEEEPPVEEEEPAVEEEEPAAENEENVTAENGGDDKEEETSNEEEE